MANAEMNEAPQAKPDIKSLELAMSQVRANPLSRQSLLNLIQIEK